MGINKTCHFSTVAWDVFRFGSSYSWDVLELGRFIVRRFGAWDVIQLGRFGAWEFCS